KLYEELLMEEEGLLDTPNKLIHIGKPIEFDEEWFERQLEQLDQVANQDVDSIREDVKKVIPTYCWEKR
ncbi:polysaccharide biosynthesis protein, partial [Clostridiaceae bacterium]|nr:polysaccharide biosynthesis protein [Clostridiaceae bacterium]